MTRALSICLAAALLAGCGVPPRVSLATPTRAMTASRAITADTTLAEITFAVTWKPQYKITRVAIVGTKGGEALAVDIVNLNGDLGQGHEVQVSAKVNTRDVSPAEAATLVRGAKLAEGIGERDRAAVLALLVPSAPTI